jgi:hypothetical protein
MKPVETVICPPGYAKGAGTPYTAHSIKKVLTNPAFYPNTQPDVRMHKVSFHRFIARLDDLCLEVC